MFGDIGEGIVNDDGICYILIDPTFHETINTSQYQVFLQAYGEGTVYVAERHTSYFIVRGTVGLQFGWEIKAKQSDFDQWRLDQQFDLPEYTDEERFKYVESANEHLMEIEWERRG